MPRSAKQSDHGEGETARRGGVEKIAGLGVHAAAIILQFAAVALVINAFYRYSLGGGFGVITEVTRFALLIVVFLGLAGTHLISGHVRVEILLAALPRWLRGTLEGWLIPIISIVYLSLLGWAGWIATIQMYTSGTTTPSRPAILLWPFASVIPAGCGLLILVLLIQLVRQIAVTRESRANAGE